MLVPCICCFVVMCVIAACCFVWFVLLLILFVLQLTYFCCKTVTMNCETICSSESFLCSPLTRHQLQIVTVINIPSATQSIHFQRDPRTLSLLNLKEN